MNNSGKISKCGGKIIDEFAFYDNYYNLKSTVDVHEAFHVYDTDYGRSNEREARAYKAELDSPFFTKCSIPYQEKTRKLYDKYK